MKKNKWHFVDLDQIKVDSDEHYFKVVGDLPGGIRVKSPVKRDVAEQFKDLVDKNSQTKLKGIA